MAASMLVQSILAINKDTGEDFCGKNQCMKQLVIPLIMIMYRTHSSSLVEASHVYPNSVIMGAVNAFHGSFIPNLFKAGMVGVFSNRCSPKPLHPPRHIVQIFLKIDAYY